MSIDKQGNKRRRRKPASNKKPIETFTTGDSSKVEENDTDVNIDSIADNVVDAANNLMSDNQKNDDNVVSKDVLRNETIFERLNWWYKDLNTPGKRIAAQLGSLLVIAGLIWGLRSGILDLGISEQSLIAEFVSILFAVVGLRMQTSLLRMPKGK